MSEKDKYKSYALSKLDRLKPVFAKAAIGDFTGNIAIPDEDDEFTELYVGIQTVLEVIREQFTELHETASHYNNILESTRDGVIVEQNEFIVYANKSFARIFGFENSEDVIGKHMSEFLTPEDFVRMRGYGEERLTGNHVPNHYDFRGVDKDGRLIDLEAAVEAWSIPGKSGIVTVVRDMTDRRKAEEQIKQSLIEKEILLKEIHHRVKNNLQIIRSLLSLQLRFIKDKEAADFISESMNRITSISLIHELFYKHEDLSKIDFRNYLNQLVIHLFNVYAVSDSRIKADIRIDEVIIGIDTAVPCGLIINELLTNCLKYAFPGSAKGCIIIEMKISQNDIVSIVVKDNGVGVPENFDVYSPPSMGMQLVLTLIGQLEGYIDLDRSAGTKFTIKFPYQNR